MSSQLATPLAGGLPDHSTSPTTLRDFAEPTWSDHLNLDRQNSNPESSSSVDGKNAIHTQRTLSLGNADADQQRKAVGNLLAALNPIGVSQAVQTNGDNALNDNEQDSRGEASFVGQSDRASVSQPPAQQPPVVSLLESTTHERHASQISEDQLSLPPINAEAYNGSLPDDNGNPSSMLPNTTSELPAPPTEIPKPAIHDRREVEAFAKIEFEDGNYYITTWACELGRDALAYKTALARAEEAKNNPTQSRPQSSSGRQSRPSDRVRRPGDSQVQGSVVSEAGGFGGVDEDPVLQDGEKKSGTGEISHSSQVSASDVVKPQEVLLNPIIPFDYHLNAMRQAAMDPDNEKPAPVTADHLPNADTCPLIPIHATTNSTKDEVATHKGISRRHVRIEWDFDKECFQMRVLGRNGAFLDGVYIPRGMSKRLSSGSKIQISDVQMTFRLPRPKTEPLSDESDRDEAEHNENDWRGISDDERPSTGKINRLKLTLNHSNGADAATAASEILIGPDGQPIPPKKRGPGRPPKDGIMSTRERREREKAIKLAEAKAANGGQTPPPSARLKLTKPPAIEEEPKEEAKPEKRKYKKRKRPGEDGDVLPSIEGGDADVASETEKAPVKKARASKSPSPEYPPVETLTEEQLARPSEPYARLIYDILAEIHPKALPLKQIYRALKLKYPFFVYRVDSEGWQSSVRHNLNQEWNKLFEKGEKEGKGFAWKAIPGALQPQAERKRAAAAAAKPKPPTTPRNQQPPQGPTPPLHWQNNTPFPPNGMQRGPPPPYWQAGSPGSYPPPPPPNGIPWPPPPGSLPPAGTPITNGPLKKGPGQNNQPFQAPQQPQPQTATSTPAQSAPHRPTSSNASPHPTQLPQQTRPSQAQHTPPQQLAPPPISSSSSAAPNMPCTLDGLMAIRRFESAMYGQVKDNTNGGIGYWQAIFASVKNRMLHGAPESSMPGGESKEERTIMEHVRAFIEKFKNPNFVGFSNAPSQSRTVSPLAPTDAGVKESASTATGLSAKQTPSKKDEGSSEQVSDSEVSNENGTADELPAENPNQAVEPEA